MSRPIAVPALPRTSSATSGLSFCGIIDEPVAASSGSVTKPNSARRTRGTISSPIRERCAEAGPRTHRGSRGRSPGRRPRRASSARLRSGRRARGRASSRRARPRPAGSAPPARAAWREADEVALEHRCPGEEVVPERDRLRPLQMGVAGQERLGLALRTARGSTSAKAAIAVARLARRRPRRRGGTQPQPGRCASALRGSCGRRAPSRRSSVEWMSSSSGDEGGALLADGGQTGLDLAQLRRRRGARTRAGDARARASPSQSYGRSSASSARRNSSTSGASAAVDACGPEGQTGAPFRARAAASSVSRAAIWT